MNKNPHPFSFGVRSLGSKNTRIIYCTAFVVLIISNLFSGCDSGKYESEAKVTDQPNTRGTISSDDSEKEIVESNSSESTSQGGQTTSAKNQQSQQQEEKKQQDENAGETKQQETEKQAEQIKELKKQESEKQEYDVFPDTHEMRKKPINIDLGKEWIRPMKTQEIWVDMKKKEVLVGGFICLRGGVLEMFACPEGTKEHESVIAVFAEPEVVHTALVAIGAKKGNPVQYDPTYKPASGAKMTIEVMWKEDGKVVKRNAKEMVRQINSGKTLQHDWVFGGSAIWKNTPESEPYYLANGGEFICVSNFPSAMMDLPIESTSTDEALLFEAFTEKIPPLKTRVLIKLVPEIKKDEKPEGKDTEKTAGDGKKDKNSDENNGDDKSQSNDDGN